MGGSRDLQKRISKTGLRMYRLKMSGAGSLLLLALGTATQQGGIHQLMGSSRPGFALFEPEGCGAACGALRPLWSDLASSLKQAGIAFVAVECTHEPETCVARKVAASDQPVLKFWTGTTFRRYSGQMTVRAIEDYASKKLATVAEEMKQERAARPQAPVRRAVEMPSRLAPSLTSCPVSAPPEADSGLVLI